MRSSKGALTGIRVIEFAGKGPGPFCAMMLGDHGAEVIRIDRPGATIDPGDVMLRNRRSVVLDLKSPDAVQVARDLCAGADVVIEGFRPGVMERLGLGPSEVMAANETLVYARMTGWGQDGPLSTMGGHDINYIALAGMLHTIGPADGKPVIPVNYAGDFGGGGMMLAFGVVSALLQVRSGGEGQVIDCSMTEGAALLTAMTWSLLHTGRWRDERGVNYLDGGAHFYDTYLCADGRSVAVGAIEPSFYAELCAALDLDQDEFAEPGDSARWPDRKRRIAEIFRTRSRDEWCAIMEGRDACFAPVLSLAEAPEHPHNRARASFIDVAGYRQPGPAPRFSSAGPFAPKPPPAVGDDTDAILTTMGYAPERIRQLRERNAIG